MRMQLILRYTVGPLTWAALLLAGCAATPSRPLYQPAAARQPNVPLEIGRIGASPGYVTAAITATPPQTPCDPGAYQAGFRAAYALTWDRAVRTRIGQLRGEGGAAKAATPGGREIARLDALRIHAPRARAGDPNYATPPASLTAPAFCGYSSYQEGARDGNSAGRQAWAQVGLILTEVGAAHPH